MVIYSLDAFHSGLSLEKQNRGKIEMELSDSDTGFEGAK